MTAAITFDDERRPIPAHLRRKRIWNVSDFAEFAGISHKAARKRLRRYNDALEGKLLTHVGGRTGDTFQPAYLARVIREAIGDTRLEEAVGLFDPIDSIEIRFDDLDDRVEALGAAQRMIAAQTGHNTKDIARLKRARRMAA